MNILLYSIGFILKKFEGIKSYYIREKNLRRIGLTDASGVIRGAGVNLAYPQNIHIGKNTYVNGGDLIASKNSKIHIGEN